jgi:hypothetical protein
MARLLFLTHRLPYPPDKGDKIHTYHLLRHLAKDHRVLLGTFVDDPLDEQYVKAVGAFCADLYIARLSSTKVRWRAVHALAKGEPISVSCYRDSGLEAWVRAVQKQQAVDVVILHSSSMLQYADLLEAPSIADLNDVDSLKWQEYGATRRWPMSWIYRREARLLLETERRGARRAKWSLFATEREASLFRALAPDSANRVRGPRQWRRCRQI